MPRIASLCFLAIAAFSPSCTEIEPLELGACGNGVVEPPREQCDFLPGATPPGGRSCNAECKYTCTVSQAAERCLPGYACKVDRSAASELGVCELENVCGNGVREPNTGEECDGADLPLAGGRCGAPIDGAGACRYTCLEGQACPAGYSCNLSGVCLFHSGQFDDRLSPFSFSGLDLSVGDFDGDGKLDLASIFGHDLETRYGDGAGSFSESRRTAFLDPSFQVAAGDFDLDGFDDAVVPQNVGLSLLRGRGDRSLLPALDAAIPVDEASRTGIRTTHVRTSSTGGEYLVFVAGQDVARGELAAFIFDAVSEPDEDSFYRFASDEDATAIVGLLPVELDRGASGPGFAEEVIIAVLGDDRLRIVSPECVEREGRCVAWKPVFRGEVLLGDRIGGRPVLAELDGDGAIDILVPGATGAVLSGRGDGRGGFAGFDGRPILGVDPVIAALFPPSRGEPDLPEISAAGDFNGDGIDDLISDELIALSAGPRSWVKDETIALFGPILQSAVGDFDGDGALDFVSASIVERGVIFFLGDASGRFRSAFVATSGYPLHLIRADFDGDGVDDLAVSERDAVFEQRARSISVIYGNYRRTPSDAVQMGLVERIGALDAFDSSFAPSYPDGADDLLAISDPTETTGPGATILFGNTSRRLFSPLTLSTGDSAPEMPLGTTAGDFDGDGDADIFAVTASAAWMLPGGAGGLRAAAATRVDLKDPRLASCVALEEVRCSLLVAGNIVPEEVSPASDEAILVDGCTPRELHISWLRAPGEEENWSCERLILSTMLVKILGYHTGDLDNDGAAELVLAFSGNYIPENLVSPELPPFDPRGSGVLVLWGDPNGDGLSADRQTILDFDLFSAAALGVGSIRLDADGDRELVILTPHELRFADVTRAGSSALELRVAGGETMIFSKIIAADVDSDGLEDLLVKDDSRVQVLLSIPGGAR